MTHGSIALMAERLLWSHFEALMSSLQATVSIERGPMDDGPSWLVVRFPDGSHLAFAKPAVLP